MKSKHAQSHVEIILSFVIFIGFLLFVFMFMNPFAKTEPVYIMDNIQKAIIDEISSEIGKLSAITNGSSCYSIPAYLTIEYGNNFKEVPEDNKKYVIYFSDIFEKEGIISCSDDPLNYTLATYSQEEIVVYGKIIDLKTDYENDYNNLKKSLGMTNDFLFKTKNMVGEEITELSVDRKIPKGINVEAREIPIRVINSDGDILELILNIKAW